jgi:hypothetical protein
LQRFFLQLWFPRQYTTRKLAGSLAGWSSRLARCLFRKASIISKLVPIVLTKRNSSGAHFQQYYNQALHLVRNPGSIMSAASSSAGSIQPQNILNQARNFSTADLTSVGIIAAEVIGFFTVGEIIGRLKIVGYRTSGDAHH